MSESLDHVYRDDCKCDWCFTVRKQNRRISELEMTIDILQTARRTEAVQIVEQAERISSLESDLKILADWKFRQTFTSNDICRMSDIARAALERAIYPRCKHCGSITDGHDPGCPGTSKESIQGVAKDD